MRPLLVFYLQSGIRVGLRSAAVLFGAFALFVIVQDSPSEVVTSAAMAAFRPDLRSVDVAPLLLLSLLLPLWARGRLSGAVDQWLGHLPAGAADRQRALTAALVAAQLPLVVALACAAGISRGRGLTVAVPLIRWHVWLVAAAMASVPSQRRFLAGPLSLAAGFAALFGPAWTMAGSFALLTGIDALSSLPARPPQTVRTSTGGNLARTVFWRALGVRIPAALGLGLLAIGAGWAFVRNNQLHGAARDGGLRFWGAMALVLCLLSLARPLATRRPAWAFARSLPWSARDRVSEDAFLLALHALPLVLIVTVVGWRAGLACLALLPYLSIRTAGYVRLMTVTPNLALSLFLEGLVAAAMLALVPWLSLVALIAVPAALRRSAHWERTARSTRWSESQLAGHGDTAWSDA